MLKQIKLQSKDGRGVRQEFSNKPRQVAWGRREVGAIRTGFVFAQMQQWMCRTARFQDGAGGYAAGASKQDVYQQSSAPTGSHVFPRC